MPARVSYTADEIPVHYSGPWPFVFVVPDGTAVFADTRTEIVDAVIDGYGSLPEPDGEDDPAFEARIDSLAGLGSQAQAGILAGLDDGEDILPRLDDGKLTALFTPKDSWPIPILSWDEQIPLILLVTNFEPYTVEPAPSGERIVWLDPTTETGYLDSLAKLGVGELHVPIPAAG